MSTREKPPAVARALLRTAAPAGDRDCISDDLDEEFHLVRHQRGVSFARCWYRAQVLRSLVPLLLNRLTRNHDVPALPRRTPSQGDLAGDVRFAWRGLRRSPGFAITAMATLAIGIGANATMFSVLDRLMLQPPAHVHDPERLSTITFVRDVDGRTIRQSSVSYPMYEALRGSGAFASVAAFAPPQAASLGRGGEARPIRLQLASGEYFTTLGARPYLGRFFLADDNRLPAGQPVAVLGFRFWRERFGSDTTVIGRDVTIGDRRFQVIGVAPRDFTGTGLSSVDAWVPIAAAGGLRFGGLTDWATARDFIWLRLVVRRAAEADSARAAQAAMLGAREGLGTRGAVTGAELVPILRRYSAGQSPNVRISRLLLAVTGFVLLIACGNLVNLLLARAVRRRSELAVRVALGADRVRLMRLLLLESLMISAGGAIGAVFVARWGGDVIRTQLLAGITGWEGRLIEPRVMAFTAAVAVITALLTGLVPAWRASRPAVSSFLRSGARDGGGQQARLRTTLLVTQAALTVVLLLGTGLLLRSLNNVNRIDLGIDAGAVMLVNADLRGAGYQPAEVAQMTRDLADRAATLPGVTSATVALGIPFSSMYGSYLRIPGLDSLPTSGGSPPSFEAVDAAYFATVGMRVVAGRAFTAAEVAARAPVAMVNEALARRAWPGREAVGQCVIVGADSAPCSTVIGVVSNAHRISLMEEAPSMSWFVPIGTEAEPLAGSRSVLIRLDASGLRSREAIRRQLQEAIPNLPWIGLQPLRDLLAGEYRPWEMGATLFSVFGGVALLIAAIGWYASLAYDVNQRRRELGVRLALGARPAGLVRYVVERGVRVVLLGLVAGGGLAVVGVRWVREFLYGVSPVDPVVIGTVVAVMVATAVAATLVPATRAARTDPAEALRGDT